MGKREDVDPRNYYHDSEVKNNKSSIDRLSKDAVIAAVGGIIIQCTNQIKARLG